MTKLNDAQDQAIWNSISKEHRILSDMYEGRDIIKGRHREELDEYIEKIKKQARKVEELCEGRVKFYTDPDNKLILDLTDKEESDKK